jgi:hypothetical protein
MFISREQAFILVAAASLGIARAHAATVTVNGTDNPYLAGQPTGTACCGGDAAPAESPVLASKKLSGGEILTFSTTGSVGYAPDAVAPSADGYPDYPFSMTADYGTGVSGPLDVYVSGLVGVFTTGKPPVGPAPAQLDSGVTFTTLSPGLAQIFWIGDGRTGTGKGTRQQFTVPVGAKSLYLGVVDGSGWYDNPGQIIVKMKVTAAPSAR